MCFVPLSTMRAGELGKHLWINMSLRQRPILVVTQNDGTEGKTSEIAFLRPQNSHLPDSIAPAAADQQHSLSYGHLQNIADGEAAAFQPAAGKAKLGHRVSSDRIVVMLVVLMAHRAVGGRAGAELRCW